MKPRTRPHAYGPPLQVPFIVIRTLNFISTFIVAAILGWFCYQLQNDGFKLPWTILVMLLASFCLLSTLILTTCLHACTRRGLSPLLNLLLHVPVLLLWIIGFGLFVYNINGTLNHSCSKTNWGNGDGMMICNIFKTMFSFVVIGGASQIAALVVDIRARRGQYALGGAYEDLDSNKTGSGDLTKMDPLDRSRSASDASNTAYDNRGIGLEGFADRPSPIEEPPTNPYQQKFNPAWGMDHGHVSMQDFSQSASQPSTAYSGYNYYGTRR